MFNDYVRRTLKYETDLSYDVFGNVGEWTWDNGSFTDKGPALATALAKNPHMRVLVTCGYYDLATPFAAAEYTVAHMPMDRSLLPNVAFTYYPAGHMMYIESGSLVKFTDDVKDFYGGK